MTSFMNGLSLCKVDKYKGWGSYLVGVSTFVTLGKKVQLRNCLLHNREVRFNFGSKWSDVIYNKDILNP